ncbi:hypothetical protein [Thalassiella azotivora]
MELQQVVERYARSIEQVDPGSQATGVNARTGRAYLPGFKALSEEPAVEAIDEAWELLHPGERSHRATKVRYPLLPATAKLDHVIDTTGTTEGEYEWGIEVKRLQFVGDNGGANDFATAKVLSPYLKDRGMLHDALRLREYGFTRRIAVIGYSFDYDATSVARARTLHPALTAQTVLDNISTIIRNNGPLRTRPLIEFADAILGLRGFTSGPRAEESFDAWTHPAGGRGVVFGWEIRRPDREPDYDPRHPW